MTKNIITKFVAILSVMSLFIFFEASANSSKSCAKDDIDCIQDKQMAENEAKRIKHDNIQRHHTEEEFEAPIYGEW